TSASTDFSKLPPKFQTDEIDNSKGSSSPTVKSNDELAKEGQKYKNRNEVHGRAGIGNALSKKHQHCEKSPKDGHGTHVPCWLVHKSMLTGKNQTVCRHERVKVKVKRVKYMTPCLCYFAASIK